MAVDFEALRGRLRDLPWERGLTRDAIRRRCPDLPEEVYLHLPSEKVFRGVDELIIFARRAVERGQEPDVLAEAETVEGSPGGWGDSPSGKTIVTPDAGHGVGSGAHPGYTGGGSAEVSPGREGTTYGDEYSRPKRISR